MAFIAGRFSGTWNALAIGQVADGGFKLSHSFFHRLITGDSFGDTPQDAVFRGGEMFADYTLIEANAAAAQTLAWPYSATNFDMGVIGRLVVGAAIAKSLVLTALAGTSAATVPATQTHLLTVLREGFPVDILMASNLREIPISQRIYPSTSGVFGTQT